MITWNDRIYASGDGYNGRYRFVGTNNGWVLLGEGGDYLTPGIGYPIYGSTPDQLLTLIRLNRPGLQVKVMD